MLDEFMPPRIALNAYAFMTLCGIELLKNDTKWIPRSVLGRTIRFKSWQRESLGSDEPPEQVKNLLTPVHVKDQENTLLSWLCHASDTIVKGDLFVPSSKYDIRLKLRTGESTYIQFCLKHPKIFI